MFTLKKLNVVRMVATEKERKMLLLEGFKEVIEEAPKVLQAEKVVNKRSKGKK